MATNPYFQHTVADEEQDLIEDLIIESIQIYGIDVNYAPRELVNYDKLFGEDVSSAFTDAKPVEMYLKNFTGFEGQGDFLAKFGLESRDEIVFTCSIKRFKEELTTIPRPREGDLLYIPLVKAIFEVKYVEDREVYYQWGKLYTYEIRTRRYEASNQTVDTGIDEFDGLAVDGAYTVDMTFDSGFGSYTPGEIVFQGVNLAAATAKAKVKSWDSFGMKLTVYGVSGTFLADQNVIGNESLATYVYNDESDLEQNSNDQIKDNEFFINDTEDIISDDQESRPF